MESRGGLDNLFDEISYDLKTKGAPDLPLQDGRSTNNIDFDFANNFDPITNKEDFTNLYDGVYISLRMSGCQVWRFRTRTQ
jgi:hypothetical protein